MTIFRKERLKNFIIALLFISLLMLTLFNWAYDREDTAFFSGTTAVETAVLPITIPEPARPILVAVTRGGEIFAAGDGDAAVGAVYDRFKTLFAEALASVLERRAITQAAWDAAMETDSVFFEFLDSVPVWALAEEISFTASPSVDELSLKSFILCGDSLLIYTGEAYFRCDVFLDFSVPEQPENILRKAGFVNGVIVFERGNSYPIAVLSDRFREEPYLSGILTAMGLNPNTNWYGDRTFVDELRTLYISPDGKITYHDGTVYPYEPFDEREALRLCLNAIPMGTAFWGGGQLILSRMELFEGGARFEFSYTLNGALFLERGAVFEVKGAKITEVNMRLCPASFGEESVELMPRRQAALLLPEGKALNLCYAESADGAWLPQWYAR